MSDDPIAAARRYLKQQGPLGPPPALPDPDPDPAPESAIPGTDAQGNDPHIGGPDGGKTRSHMHIQKLPPWMPPLPVNFELTEREIAIAEIAAFKNWKILHRVIIAMSIVVVIGGCGTTVGWVFVQREAANRATAIQRSRLEVLTDSCRETNLRNVKTLAQARELYGGDNPTARQRQSKATVTLLVNALQPYRKDCKAYAQKRLRKAAP